MSPRRRSPASVATAFLASIVLVFVGQGFGLNGAQWHWWRLACFAGAAIVAAVTVICPRLRTATQRLPRRGLLGAAVAGAALLAAALAIMSSRYSDPYGGRRLWPHALALLGLLGFAVASVSIAALARDAR